ncbi:SH3 beta-barrel fold-containing protein [Alistipes senegalensis]|nr:SH3 beta-barrel fold-containing protein [Alistipes senegalensis]
MLSASSKSKPRSQGNRGCVVYFDLDREDWRCFCPENFITIHP